MNVERHRGAIMAILKEFDELVVSIAARAGCRRPLHEMRENSVRCLGPHGLHRMAYTEWGDPANPRVLICVHGLTRNGRDFDVLANALASDYRVVCPDVVGRGPQRSHVLLRRLRRADLRQRHDDSDRPPGGRVGALAGNLDGWPDRHVSFQPAGFADQPHGAQRCRAS
jgi:hypothetical protein